MSIFTYGFRVNKIFKNENETAFFTPSEIVSAIVNLLDAKKSLTRDEYFFVSVVFETYRQIKRKLLLSKCGFIGLCNEIIAHLDLIAPYYKFCGDSRMRIMMLEEDEKYEYRQRAKAILKQKAIFKEEWMNLHQEFLEMFHSYT
ncbi:MAG: hypothetical protein IJY18_04985 [Clostridia bacterium]|nr:hypothetical protein [Clostridia bacterium]